MQPVYSGNGKNLNPLNQLLAENFGEKSVPIQNGNSTGMALTQFR
jgi:hypothetical protein